MRNAVLLIWVIIFVSSAFARHNEAWSVGDVQLNESGNYLQVKPNDKIHISLKYSISNNVDCDTCKQQLMLVIDTLPVAYIYSGIPQANPLQTEGVFSFVIDAPVESGIYTLSVCRFNNKIYKDSLSLNETSYPVGNIEVNDLTYQHVNNLNAEVINIYPIPSSGDITIDATKLSVEIENISIYNTNGKTLISSIKPINFNQNSPLNAHISQPGNYIISFKTKSQIINKRIIVSK